MLEGYLIFCIYVVLLLFAVKRGWVGGGGGGRGLCKTHSGSKSAAKSTTNAARRARERRGSILLICSDGPAPTQDTDPHHNRRKMVVELGRHLPYTTAVIQTYTSSGTKGSAPLTQKLHDRQIHHGGQNKNRGYGTRDPQKKKDNSKDENQSGPTR